MRVAWCRTSARGGDARGDRRDRRGAARAGRAGRLRGGRPRPPPARHDRARRRRRGRTASAMAGAAEAVELIDMIAHDGRSSADGRRRRDPVHAGARRHDGRVRLAGTATSAGRWPRRSDVPVYLYDRAALVARARLARRGPQGRVRGAARRRRPGRAAARLRTARDRPGGRHRGRRAQAARRVQRLPRRAPTRTAAKEIARDGARVVRRPAGRARDRRSRCPSAAGS